MAKDEHNKAAEHHDNAAKSHRAAAEQHGKGDHAKGREHSATAQQHAQSAGKQSEQAAEVKDGGARRQSGFHISNCRQSMRSKRWWVFRCAKRISTFLRSSRDLSNSGVPIRARA
jgi:hypothetical protein